MSGKQGQRGQRKRTSGWTRAAPPYPPGKSGFEGRLHDLGTRQRLREKALAREAAKRAARDHAKDEKVQNKEQRRAERQVFLDHLEKLRQAEPEAFAAIIRGLSAPKPSDQLAAANALLDRTRGRPVTPSVQLTASAGELTGEEATRLLERMLGTKLARRPGAEPEGHTLQVPVQEGQPHDQ